MFPDLLDPDAPRFPGLGLGERPGEGLNNPPPEEEDVPVYRASPTGSLFHGCNDFFRGVMGPVGSGKSVMGVMEIYMRAFEQAPYKGVRRSRWALIRNCYDDQTEILTENRGFQLFRDLLPSDRVATLDNDTIRYRRPDGVAVHPYNGKMIGFESESVDFLVTPDHKMHVSRVQGRKKLFGPYHEESAQEVFDRGRKYPCYRVKKSVGHWDGEPTTDFGGFWWEEFSVDMFEFFGYWFAEGTADVAYARDLLRRARLTFSVSGRPGEKHTFNISHKRHDDLFSLLSTCGKATTKRVPSWMLAADGDRARAFLRGFSVGDGHTRKEGTVTLYTSSRHMADALQEFALKAGCAANVNSRDRRGKPVVFDGIIAGKVNAIEYCVTLLGSTKMEPYLYQQPGKKNSRRGWYEQDYSGFVYCVELPMVPVYVRRNGKAFWCYRTYPELLSTTLKTWEDWIPRDICRISRASPVCGTLTGDVGDGTTVEAEVFFLALDSEDDVKKLKSLELTGGFLNEASEIRKSVLDMLSTRVGRYPPQRWGGPTWRGIFADTNPPDDSHWWYQLAEVERPRGYRFFRQPPGLFKVVQKDSKAPPLYVPNDGTHGMPAAENIGNLDGGFDYYLRQISGKNQEWIDVYVMGNYGSIVSGRAVYPEFSDRVHVSDAPLAIHRALPLLLAFDFGLTPSCIFMQQSTKNGQVRVLREFVSEDMGIDRFTRDIIRPALASTDFHGMMVVGVGDPAGGQRSQADETSCFDILRRHGIPVEPAPSNSFLLRREAVAFFLTKLSDGEPGFLLDPSCKMLRRGFAGKYQYRKMKVSGYDRYAETPDKNEYSHPHDALQYGCSFYRRGFERDSLADSSAHLRPVLPANSAAWT